MKSIRQQLKLGLLVGFSLLLGAGGMAVYFFLRTTLTRQFDAALLGQAVTMASSVKAGNSGLQFQFSDQAENGLAAPGGVSYYQLWEAEGKTPHRSRSLGTAELAADTAATTTPKYFNVTLPGNVAARGVGFRFTPMPGGIGNNSATVTDVTETLPPLALAVAADRCQLDQALNAFIAIVALTTIFMLFAAGMFVEFVLRRGLYPLDQLAEQARQIGAGSLAARFPTDTMPDELLPIGERLNDLLARLERSFIEMSEYASKVAHELRTPLSILRLKVELAGGKVSPDMADDLQAEIQQLTHVVDQSLCIAKAEQGRLKLVPRLLDLAALVAEVAEDFSLLAEEQERRVRIEPRRPQLPVSVDPKYTRQIIHNLLANALKHGQGDIVVRLAGRTQCAVTIFNRTRAEGTRHAETLGLGLRVVASLLQVQPELRSRRRQGRSYYAVRLVFPLAISGEIETNSLWAAALAANI